MKRDKGMTLFIGLGLCLKDKVLMYSSLQILSPIYCITSKSEQFTLDFWHFEASVEKQMQTAVFQVFWNVVKIINHKLQYNVYTV